MKPASADRTARALCAALTLASPVANSAAWKTGLARLPDSEESRNAILPDAAVRAIVAAAYDLDPAFGLLVELAAVTGARASQLLRTEVRDLQDTGSAPRLMVPNSRKGRHPKIERKPLPIPPALARALRTAAAGRPEGDPLLLRADGSRWRHIDLALFRKAVAAAGIDNPKLTPYCLRHSSIVRALLAGVPVRVVASSHDTSVAMIEKHYSDHISDHSDTIVRKAMLDLSAPAAAPLNVIPIVGRK